MKKIVSLLMAIFLILGMVLSGCEDKPRGGDKSQAENEVTQPDATDPSQNDGECSHADEDEDRYCDDCKIYLLVNFDFYVVNDMHGKFTDTDIQPGADELTTYLKTKYNSDENAIFLSSGDMWQGSSESNLTGGLIMTEWMNSLDFVAMTMGNHEFDWGEERILQNYEIAEFPFLAINIYNRNTNEQVEYCDSSVMIERSGLQIGIIGAIGDCYSSIASDHTKDIFFYTGDDLTELVKAESDKLRAEGADLIVYSIHDGYGGSNYNSAYFSDRDMDAYYDSVLSEGYVDIVFEGHTHKYYAKADTNGVYHLQGGGENQGISHMDVSVNILTGEVLVLAAEFISSDEYSDYYSGDPIVEDLLDKYNEQVSVGLEVLGYNRVNRSGSWLCELSAQLYYAFGEEVWGDEYDIVLGGGFLSPRSPGYLKSGDVTYSQLQMIFPFDNQLVLCSIKGKDLKEKFLETDNDRYYIYCGSYGQSVAASLDPNATYYVVVDTYTSTYKYNNLTEIQRYDPNLYLRDLLAEYVKEGNLA